MYIWLGLLIMFVFSLVYRLMLPSAWWDGHPMYWYEYIFLSAMCESSLDYGELKQFGAGAIAVGFFEYFLGYAIFGYAITVLLNYNTLWQSAPDVLSLEHTIAELKREGGVRDSDRENEGEPGVAGNGS